MKWTLFALINSILLLSVSCKSIEPVLPDTEVNTLPVLEQKTSSVSLPIEINLEPYLKDVESSLPKVFRGKEDNCSGVSYSYKFERNPIKFNGHGQYLNYEVAGKYSLNLNYCPECTYLIYDEGSCVIPRIYASCGVGEAMRKVNVAYTTKIELTPDYKLRANTKLSKFDMIDPCEITVFHYDATSKVKKEVTGVLKDLEKDIDESIGSVDIKTDIEEIWKMIGTPVALGNYGFLCIQPKDVSISKVDFNQKKAQLDVNLFFRPVVSTNDLGITCPALPNLSEHKAGDGFEINMDILASYDSLSSILCREIGGKSLDIKNNHVVFDSIGIQSAAGNKLNFKVKFSGKKKGTLYFTGTPTFDSTTQIVSFPDLEFDIKTKNALLKSAKWLFTPKITEMIRQQAVFDINPHLKDLKTQLDKEINREITEGIYLKGSMNDVSITSIFPTENQLIIRSFASGKLSLKM